MPYISRWLLLVSVILQISNLEAILYSGHFFIHPVVMKKDGTERFCVDYRKLNGVTRRVRILFFTYRKLSIVYMVLSTFHVWTFGQAIGRSKLTASLRQKQFLPPITVYSNSARCLSASLNVPSTFQRLMHAVLCGLQYDICLVSLDDIIAFSQTFDNHLKHLNNGFIRRRSTNIRLKPIASVHLDVLKLNI